MRQGKPVLAGRLDAGREVVADGVTGRAVDAGNEMELLEGLLEVSGPRAAEFGKAGRQRFEDYFDYPHFRDRFAAEVQKLVSETS
jgi:glycosyltransferase involved in cell wall biosynthesis